MCASKIVSKDNLGAILAAGIISWVGLEALINIAVLVGALPFAGNALPLISYGGSNLVMTLTAMGVLLSISRRREDETIPRKTRATGLPRDYRPRNDAKRDATIDFGRRDRRWSVSRLIRR